MRRRIDVAAELKRLGEGFIDREVSVVREVQSRPNRYGHTTWIDKTVTIRIVDFEGVPVEYNFLLKLLKTFKQTRVKSVTVEAVPDGVHLLFERAFYFLKGIEDGRR
jgi:hypothetical protein